VTDCSITGVFKKKTSALLCVNENKLCYAGRLQQCKEKKGNFGGLFKVLLKNFKR